MRRGVTMSARKRHRVTGVVQAAWIPESPRYHKYKCTRTMVTVLSSDGVLWHAKLTSPCHTIAADRYGRGQILGYSPAAQVGDTVTLSGLTSVPLPPRRGQAWLDSARMETGEL